jgi:hypothetical protein
MFIYSDTFVYTFRKNSTAEIAPTNPPIYENTAEIF